MVLLSSYHFLGVHGQVVDIWTFFCRAALGVGQPGLSLCSVSPAHATAPSPCTWVVDASWVNKYPKFDYFASAKGFFLQRDLSLQIWSLKNLCVAKLPHTFDAEELCSSSLDSRGGGFQVQSVVAQSAHEHSFVIHQTQIPAVASSPVRWVMWGDNIHAPACCLPVCNIKGNNHAEINSKRPTTERDEWDHDFLL